MYEDPSKTVRRSLDLPEEGDNLHFSSSTEAKDVGCDFHEGQDNGERRNDHGRELVRGHWSLSLRSHSLTGRNLSEI